MIFETPAMCSKRSFIRQTKTTGGSHDTAI
jgi:hypothetical protein